MRSAKFSFNFLVAVTLLLNVYFINVNSNPIDITPINSISTDGKDISHQVSGDESDTNKINEIENIKSNDSDVDALTEKNESLDGTQEVKSEESHESNLEDSKTDQPQSHTDNVDVSTPSSDKNIESESESESTNVSGIGSDQNPESVVTLTYAEIVPIIPEIIEIVNGEDDIRQSEEINKADHLDDEVSNHDLGVEFTVVTNSLNFEYDFPGLDTTVQFFQKASDGDAVVEKDNEIIDGSSEKKIPCEVNSDGNCIDQEDEPCHEEECAESHLRNCCKVDVQVSRGSSRPDVSIKHLRGNRYDDSQKYVVIDRKPEPEIIFIENNTEPDIIVVEQKKRSEPKVVMIDNRDTTKVYTNY